MSAVWRHCPAKFLACVLFGTLLCASAVNADFTVDKKTVKLDAFSAIQVCVPYNVLILPVPGGSPQGEYALYIEAESAVLQSTSAAVSNSTLQLQVVSGINTVLPVKITVFLPAKQLKTVASSSGLGQVTVGPGFDVETLSLYSAFGTGNVNVFNLTAKTVNVASSGTGQVFVNGTISEAVVAAGGTASVLVLGLSQSANVNLAGASSAVFGFSNSSAVITGITTGSNSVTSNVQGCNVQTAFLFGAPCLTQLPLTVPTINPVWSCGLNITGSMTCPAGGIQGAASSSAVGVAFSNSLPAFLAPSTSTATVTQPPAISAGGVAVSPIAATALDGAVKSVSPSGTTVVNIGSGNRAATASGPGSQTAVAVSGNTAAAQQAALNSLVAGLAGRKLLSKARKLQQTGNAALDALLASFNAGSSSVSVSSSSTTSTPNTFTSTTGPGSLACAYANGQGGCQGGLLGSNNLISSASTSGGSTTTTSSSTTASPPALNDAASNLASLLSGGSGTGVTTTGSSSNVVSSSSSVSSGNGPSQVTTFTSGPGASASGCSTVNGVSNCQQSVNGSPPVKIPGTTFFGDTGAAAAAVPPTPAFPVTGTRVVATTSQSSDSSSATSITGGVCQLSTGMTVNIFGN